MTVLNQYPSLHSVAVSAPVSAKSLAVTKKEKREKERRRRETELGIDGINSDPLGVREKKVKKKKKKKGSKSPLSTRSLFVTKTKKEKEFIQENDTMTSKSKKKHQEVVNSKDGTPWIVDENGNKIKKVRKKIRRRASTGNAGHGSREFGAAQAVSAPLTAEDLKNQPKSSHTMATEASSGHISYDEKSHRSHRSTKSNRSTKSKKSKSKKPKSKRMINEKGGQLWHLDSPSKSRKKSADLRMAQSEHGTSPLTAPTKKKKKASKSVRHLSSRDLEEDSDDPLSGTVNTTGTLSQSPRAGPRKYGSTPNLSPREFIERHTEDEKSNEDLDILMTQSVHEHARKEPTPMKKPKLMKSQSVLGKIVHKTAKSTKKLGKAIAKSFPKDEDFALSPSKHKKKLPVDIKEIDGILWRVDEYGNKLNKVRKKQQRHSQQSLYDSNHSDELHQMSSHSHTWSGDEGPVSPQKQKRRKQKNRRNSVGSSGSFRSFASEGPQRNSFRRQDSDKSYNRRQDSEKSLYLDEKPRAPLSNRSNLDGNSLHSRDDGPYRPEHSRLGPKASEKQAQQVQNLQHRLRASEKEIARLCRVTMDQQDKMEDSQTESKRVREKLKMANRDKQALIMEVDNLRQELDLSVNSRNIGSTISVDTAATEKLVSELNELKAAKALLESKFDDFAERNKARLNEKEAEVRFLQSELEQMRAEQGTKQLEYMQKLSGMSDDDLSSCSGSHPSPLRRGRRLSALGEGKSMQFVGKILGNHMNNMAETEVALKQQEIRDLQDRVCELQLANERLSDELKQATVEMKDDDDEEMRMAKEAAMEAQRLNQKKSGSNLANKVMSLSRMHRSNHGNQGSGIPRSFRIDNSSSNDEDTSILSIRSNLSMRSLGRRPSIDGASSWFGGR